MSVTRSFPAILTLFFLSGATGLLYQVVWVRLFSYSFGATTLAISTVLASFMGGLAFGGLWGGRIAKRLDRPLFTYGLLELGLAVAAGLVPFLLKAANPIYVSLYGLFGESFAPLTAVRFAVSALILLPATFLMGATLPVLTREAEILVGESRRRVAQLYAVNTFGAVAGTVLASFVLLPGLGLRSTLVTGAVLNVVVAAIALGLARSAHSSSAPLAEEERPLRGSEPLPRRLLALGAGVLGFSALALEVLWTRTLSLALGTTTYAFAIVLSVFLLGIAGGAAIAGPLLRRERLPARFFLVAPAAIGFLALGLVPLFDRLPELFVKITSGGGGSWAESLFAKALLAGLPLLPPTLLSGAAFPLAVGIDRSFATHRSVGDLYAANTLGAILGSWAAGFLLLPRLGLQGGIEAVAALQIALTVVLILAYRTRVPLRARVAAVVLVVLGVATLASLPDWNRASLTRGGFVLGHDLQRTGGGGLGEDDSEIVFLEEGITSTVTVRRQDGEHTMQMNGVTEASTSGDLSTQVSVASLPLLLHEAPRDALVIGLGGGITAATVARYPRIESIECVEISEAVVHAAALFEAANHGVLQDPRFRLIVGDGRNHLQLSPRSYDVIISLPSHVWNSGISALMSAEFYRLCRDRLRPGGIVCTWIQGYSVSSGVLRSVLAAAGESFSRVSLWRGAWGDLLVVAGGDEFAVDIRRLLDEGKDSRIGALLRESDFPDLLSLLSLNLLAGGSLRDWVGEAPANTDDRPFLEFETPKLLYVETMEELFSSLYEAEAGIEEYLTNAPPELLAELPRIRRARALESRARLAFRALEGAKGLTALEEARAQLPSAPSIRRTLAGVLNARAVNLANQGKVSAAGEHLLRAIDVDPEFADSYGTLGELYLSGGDLARAREAAAAAITRNPRKPDHHVLLAKVLLRMREIGAARGELTEGLVLDPRHAKGHETLADLLLHLGETDRAESVLTSGLEFHPGSDELAAKLRKVRLVRRNETER